MLTTDRDVNTQHSVSPNAATTAAAASGAELCVTDTAKIGVSSISGHPTLLHADHDNTAEQAAAATIQSVAAMVDDSTVSSIVNTTPITTTPANEASANIEGNGAASSLSKPAAIGAPRGVTADAIDPEGGNPVTDSLADSADGRFAIDATTGAVTTTSRLAGGADSHPIASNGTGSTPNGSASSDLPPGDVGNITLNDETDNHLLLGGPGAEVLIGGDGNDRLVGSLGQDTLFGGGGADTFVIDVSHLTFAVDDLIADYNLCQGDVIDLSDLLAGLGATPDNVDSLVKLVSSGGGTTTTVQVDADGAGSGTALVDVATLAGAIGSALVLFDDSLGPVSIT